MLIEFYYLFQGTSKQYFLNKKDFFIIISLFRSDNLYYVNEGARKDSYEPLISNKDNHIFGLGDDSEYFVEDLEDEPIVTLISAVPTLAKTIYTRRNNLNEVK